VCAAATAAHFALAALVGMCSPVLLFSLYLSASVSHAALVAHRLGDLWAAKRCSNS